MKIEIHAGGFGGATINAFQSDFSAFRTKSENVIASFKAVKRQAAHTSGGVGNLQTGVNQLQARISQEERKLEAVKKAETKAKDFVELANRVDKQVASLVKKNKEEFYQKYPHLKPADTSEEKAWYEQAWDWLCGKGEDLVGGVKNALKDFAGAVKEGWDWVCDSAVKLWNSAVAFYEEHKDVFEIIGKVILTAVIVIGAVAAIVATRGAGLAALVPLLTAIGLSASTAAAISAVVVVTAIVSTAGAAILDVIDIWAEIDHPVFNAFQTGLNILSFVTDGFLCVGSIFKTVQRKAMSKGTVLVTSVDDVAEKAIPKTYENAVEIASKNPEAVKYIPMEDMATVGRTPGQTEIKSASMLDDGFYHQVTIDKNMNITSYGTKGAIRPDHIKAYDDMGNILNLDDMQDLTQVKKFEIIEDKNYRIQFKNRQNALWKNILEQSNSRIDYLAQHGATVEQIYRIDLAGHGKISLGELSDLYQKLMDTLPPNVNIEWMHK